MFGKPLFLHSSPILKMSSDDMVPSVKVGGTLQKLNLDTTVMPETLLKQGLIVVAMDPLWKTSDVDRIDNVFVQYVTLKGQHESKPDDQVCTVVGIGDSAGSK